LLDGDGDLDIAAAAGEVIPETESFANSTCPDANAAPATPPVNTGGAQAAAAAFLAARPHLTITRSTSPYPVIDYCVGEGPNPTPYCAPMVVYINNGGKFDRNVNWTSAQAFVSDDVVFADVDRNGYMDLVFGGPLLQVFLADAKGTISKNATWTANRVNYDGGYTVFSWNLHVDNPDNVSTIAMAATNYMGGGDGKYKVWRISNPYQTQYYPFQGSEAWSTATGGWGGGVGLYAPFLLLLLLNDFVIALY